MKLDNDYYNVIFHYNTYTETWHCVNRNEYREYFNGDADQSTGKGSTVEHAFIDYQSKQHARVL